jgi:hypothetical protein
MDVFLSLYVLADSSGASLLPFLVAAVTEDEATDLSDAFIEAVETIGQEEVTDQEVEAARHEIEVMRANICLLQDEGEIAVVTKCLREHNPNFETEMKSLAGGVFTVGVSLEAGFSLQASNTLRNRMASHYLLATLSVELE